MVDRVGQQLGNYRLTRLLGHGGFAEVYLGEHVRLGTQAAIKVLQTHVVGQEVEALQHEARIIAHLEHPHIVRVLDFDVMEGTPFLVMSYASGGTLRLRHPRGVALPLPTIITYVKQIADALQYAHEEKVIHRDIKPENMLLGRRNEVLLSDFGIATAAQSSQYQGIESMAGTVNYMAPEQIQGKPRPASDQYALGVIIYEWVSGQRPFQGSFTEIAAQHVLAPPPSIREKIPTISASLEHVIMTALEKDPHKRFASVRAFATALEQASQEEKKLPSVHIAGIPSSLPTVPLASEIRVEKKRAGLSPDSNRVRPSLARNMPSRGTPLCIYRGHSGPISSVAWSPDGTRIASASADQTAQIWESATGHHLLTYRGHKNGVRAIAWAPAGDCIASASEDQTVQVWDAPTGEPIFTSLGYSDSVWALAWSPNDEYLAFESDTKMILICDSVEGRRLRTYRGHADMIWALAWSPDSSTIASGGEDGKVQVWTAMKAL